MTRATLTRLTPLERGLRCLALPTFALLAGTAAGQVIAGPASDLWTTLPGNSMEEHFDSLAGGTPIPAGFFGAGSDPFDGTIRLMGRPLDGTPSMGPGTVGIPGQADTIVRRLAPAGPLSTCPATATVPIEIVALNLISVQPITVTFGGGAASTTWEVQVCLPSTVPQQQGQMNIIKQSPDGGTFVATLPVRPQFHFTRCSGTAGVSPATMIGPVIPFNSNGVWSYNNLGLPVLGSPGGGVDHDCNSTTPFVPYPPTSNFVGGVTNNATCTVPPGMPHKELTPEQEMLAEHGVLPPCRPPGIGYCFGDGTGAACPCGNFGLPGHGCNNSAGTGGGLLYGSGEAKVSADTLLLRCESLQMNTVGLFFQGTLTLGGGLGVIFGDGLRCVGGAQIRLGIKFTVCGKIYYGVGVGDIPVSIKGAIPLAGGVFNYQVWYRDAIAFCTPSTFNLSNGYQVAWMP